MATLPISIQEQLQSTNMCFHQVEDTLYIAGGYAYSNTAQDHITFPYLTTIIVSQTVNAIKNNQPFDAFVKQVYDTNMAVTGGHLAHLDGALMIVGGHRFDGRYNPMGHNTYVQTYTDAIRKFMVNNSQSTPVITNYSAVTDAAHLHRRDYNLLPQIFADGSFGYMISSGVFQTNVDLPFLYPVEIKANGYTPITSFNQYLSNYHSAYATLFDANSQTTHALFFGGISQYYYDNGMLMQDNNVPFVKTISRLTRNANDQLSEYKMELEMPSLEGAGAEFIPKHGLNLIENEIVVLPSTAQDSLLVGYIYGGISSAQSNPFTNNNTSSTSASSVLYEVWLCTNDSATGVENKIIDHAQFDVSIYPNPSDSEVYVQMKAPFAGNGSLLITNAEGKLIKNLKINDIKSGKNKFKLFDQSALAPGIYQFTFDLNGVYFATSSVVIK